MKKTLSIVSKKQRYRVYPFLPPRPPILIRQQHQIKNHTKPANSQSRHQITTSSTMKTTTSSIQKNQEKNISHLRHLRISQVRHLKTGSLIPCPPERISQSRRLHHFPYPSPTSSHTHPLAFLDLRFLMLKLLSLSHVRNQKQQRDQFDELCGKSFFHGADLSNGE